MSHNMFYCPKVGNIHPSNKAVTTNQKDNDFSQKNVCDNVKSFFFCILVIVYVATSTEGLCQWCSNFLWFHVRLSLAGNRLVFA